MRSGGSAQQADEQPLEEREDEEEEEEDFRDTEFPEEGELVLRILTSRQPHRVTSELETGLNVDDVGLEDWGLMEMQVDIHLGQFLRGPFLRTFIIFYFPFNKML